MLIENINVVIDYDMWDEDTVDILDYVLSFRNPRRSMTAFIAYKDDVEINTSSTKLVAQLLAKTYIRAYQPGEKLVNEYRELFKQYKSYLPQITENITVYRGMHDVAAANGISWSTSKEIAATFGSTVIERQATPAECLCFIGGTEQEIICDFT
jgi:ABC-type Fe3+-hydroxamate transport system substrate-binding protein